MSVKADLLSVSEKAEIDRWLEKYPAEHKHSALLAALRELMHTDGYLRVEKMDAVAAYLELPNISVYEAASFYSMYETKPVGKHCISVCTNVSCMLCGADGIVAHLEQKLDIKLGESTADGRFYLKREEECLAACCSAPVMQLDHIYHESLTPEKVDRILDQLEQKK